MAEQNRTVTRVLVKRTADVGEVWFFGTVYGSRGNMLAERIPFASLRKGQTAETTMTGLERNIAAPMARRWGLAIEREGY